MNVAITAASTPHVWSQGLGRDEAKRNTAAMLIETLGENSTTELFTYDVACVSFIWGQPAPGSCAPVWVSRRKPGCEICMGGGGCATARHAPNALLTNDLPVMVY
jgi:hypothetical protein